MVNTSIISMADITYANLYVLEKSIQHGFIMSFNGKLPLIAIYLWKSFD